MGKLFVIVGHSGSGKTSTMREAMGREKEIISVTTRPMREGEVHGEDYYFISDDKFKQFDLNNQLAEKTTYYGRASYGVTKSEISSKLEKGNAFIVVDVEGFKQLKSIYNDLVSIFLYTDKGTAFRRMRLRGDSVSMSEQRLETYEAEMMNKHMFDYVVKNVLFPNTISILKNIISSETGSMQIFSTHLYKW